MNTQSQNKSVVNFSRKPTDRFSFSALYGVCKRLFSVPRNTLPLSVSFQLLDYNFVQCRFYEPLALNLLSLDVHKIDLDRFSTTPRLFAHTSCKFGWLFFSTRDSGFMLYSFWSKEIITLPSLVRSISNHSRFVKTFSTEPDSPDCVFLVLEYDFSVDHRVTISTCRRGDKKWTIREFDRVDINYMCFGTTPVYIKGVFYFVSSAGEVGSYNVDLGEWKADRNLFNDIIDSKKGYGIFEFNGELVLIFFYDDASNNENGKFGYVRVFDWRRKVWVRLESLGDQALFVSSNTFLVSAIGSKARGSGVLPNKIYRLVEDGCIIYSIENGDLVNPEIVNNYRDESAFWVEPPRPLRKQIEER